MLPDRIGARLMSKQTTEDLDRRKLRDEVRVLVSKHHPDRFGEDPENLQPIRS